MLKDIYIESDRPRIKSIIFPAPYSPKTHFFRTLMNYMCVSIIIAIIYIEYGVIWTKEDQKVAFQFANSFVHLITTTKKIKIHNLFFNALSAVKII